ncbi:MAG: glutamine amidotransferase [Myxococcota bacterium]
MIEWLLGGCCGPGGTLVWTAPAWLPAAVGLAGAIAVGLATRPLPRTAGRVAEVLLLAIAAAVATFAAGGPTWLQEGERVEEGRLVALVDGSRSMGVLDADGRPRSERAKQLLAGLPDAEVYTFGDALRPGAPEGWDAPDTDLGGALAALSQRYAGEKLKGVVVITDGIDRGGLRRRVLADPAAPLPKVGGPLTVYQAGEPGARVDLAVSDVHAGGFAFLRAPFSIAVELRAVGTPRREVTVALTRDGQPAGSAVAKIGPDGKGTARFEIVPDAPGRYIYEASVPVIDGDAVPANNALGVAVRVVRDRVRVLQVNGSPSWDQKFLRLFLKEDPAVDLVSFFILRTPRDMGAGWEPDELSLIQFPYKSLFTSDLWTFDLVVLQNFDYAPYFADDADQLLGNLRDYVREGGALVMVGGDRSFDLGQYGGTAIAEVLPVALGVKGDAVDPAPFSPVLTPAGARHPITQLAGEPTESEATWARLPPLDGVNLTDGPVQGAAVLLEHPTRAGTPVLAVREVGKGRTMALMGDSSWRWSFAEAGEGRGNQAYLRFWKNAMRWLIGDPDDQPVVVEAGRENYTVGQQIQLRVRARDVAFQPIPGARVSVTVDGPGGRRALDGEADGAGEAAFVLPAVDRGAHRVTAVVKDAKGAIAGEAGTVFAVTTRDPELDEVEPDGAFLQALAARTGGKYVGPGETGAPLTDPEAGRRVRDRRVTPLYAMPLVAVAFGLAASGSWWLRRRGGLR